MRAMKAELAKTRYRKIGLSVAAIVGVEFIWCFWILTRADDVMIAEGYRYGFMELCIMNTIFLPIVLAVAASRIWDTEHKGGTWKLLETLETKAAIYRCKFILGAMYCLMISGAQILFLLVMARFFHFGQTMPADHLLWYAVSGFSVSLAVYLIQQILSMYFENQIMPLAMGLLGAFGGLFSNFFPAGVQKLVVWGYYGVLRSVNMNWEKGNEIVTLLDRPKDYGFLLYVIVLAAALYYGGKVLFLKKEF